MANCLNSKFKSIKSLQTPTGKHFDNTQSLRFQVPLASATWSWVELYKENVGESDPLSPDRYSNVERKLACNNARQLQESRTGTVGYSVSNNQRKIKATHIKLVKLHIDPNRNPNMQYNPNVATSPFSTKPHFLTFI